MKRKRGLNEVAAAKRCNKQEVLQQHGYASLCRAAQDLYERHVPFMRAWHGVSENRLSEN